MKSIRFAGIASSTLATRMIGKQIQMAFPCHFHIFVTWSKKHWPEKIASRLISSKSSMNMLLSSPSSIKPQMKSAEATVNNEVITSTISNGSPTINLETSSWSKVSQFICYTFENNDTFNGRATLSKVS